MSSPDSTPQPSSPRLEQAGASDQSIQDVHSALRREKSEPQESFAPLPLALLFLFSALIFVSALYLGRFSGNFSAMIYDERQHEVGGGGAATVQQVDPKVLGKRLYNANCTACHQVTGTGVPGAYPPLAGSEWLINSEEVPVRILLHGLTGPITVKGGSYNGAMPSFGPSGTNLRDDQIAAILTYVRSEWGNAAPEVTKETVARIRAETKDRTKNWTAGELEPLLHGAK